MILKNVESKYWDVQLQKMWNYISLQHEKVRFFVSFVLVFFHEKVRVKSSESLRLRQHVDVA